MLFEFFKYYNILKLRAQIKEKQWLNWDLNSIKDQDIVIKIIKAYEEKILIQSQSQSFLKFNAECLEQNINISECLDPAIYSHIGGQVLSRYKKKFNHLTKIDHYLMKSMMFGFDILNVNLSHSNLQSFFVRNLMEQSIDPIIQNPSNSSFSALNLAQDFERIGNAPNLLNQSSEVCAKEVKRFKNIEGLSPEILKSYQLKPTLLAHTQISENQRAKIRLWLTENCHIRKLSFRTASLACYIIDLYFSRGNKCRIEDFHELGICSLRIANKMEDNFPICIDYQVFNREKLAQIEAQICLKTDFCLNPITFTEIAHSLFYFWSSFKMGIKQQRFEYESTFLKDLSFQIKVKILQLDYAFVLLHQLTELSFLSQFWAILVIQSFKFDLDIFVSNCFYLVLCLQLQNHHQQLSAVQVSNFSRKNTSLMLIWDAFVHFCQDSRIALRLQKKEQCLEYLFPIYNDLISESVSKNQKKDNLLSFNPNNHSFQMVDRSLSQTLQFKHKINSFRKYLKRQVKERFRKCSEVTQQSRE